MLLNDSHSSGGFSLIHHPVKVSLGVQKFLTAEQAGIWSLGKKNGTKLYINIYVYISLYIFGIGSFVIVLTLSNIKFSLGKPHAQLSNRSTNVNEMKIISYSRVSDQSVLFYSTDTRQVMEL